MKNLISLIFLVGLTVYIQYTYIIYIYLCIIYAPCKCAFTTQPTSVTFHDQLSVHFLIYHVFLVSFCIFTIFMYLFSLKGLFTDFTCWSTETSKLRITVQFEGDFNFLVPVAAALRIGPIVTLLSAKCMQLLIIRGVYEGC